MRCVVVDDEPLALEMMAAYVRKTPYLELSGAFGNSIEALDFLRKNPVELAFLDIQMPDLNGLELGDLLVGSPTRLVFVTAYEQYALQGFKVEALDYLLKPVSYNDFLKAADRARRWFERSASESARADSQKGDGQEPDFSVSGTVDTPLFRSDPEHSDSFFVRADYRWVKIRMRDVLFVESVKDYVKIHLDPTGKSRQDTPGANFCVMTLQSMKALEEWLPKGDFMRVHRSYIINMNQISSVEKGKVVFSDGQSVPVSESYKGILEEAVSRRCI